MRNIAIFVSGDGRATERIVTLFNEGNRLKTVLIVGSDSASELMKRLEKEDVVLMNVPDDRWGEFDDEIKGLLESHAVSMLVSDHFELPISKEIMATTEGKFVTVTTPEEAPREVVAELESDLRKPKIEVEKEPEKKENPTPEEEWAETLKINFIPPKVPQEPPRVPAGEKKEKENPPLPGSYRQTQAPSGGYDPYNREKHLESTREPERREEQEPMPSTYLIWSILSTIFCCFIPGIVAIIFSSQVSTKYFAGDIEGSKRASRMAEIWIIASVIIGAVTAVFYLPFMLLG